MDVLVKAGADIFDHQVKKAARMGSERCVQLFLEAGVHPDRMIGVAAEAGQLNIVAQLMKGGAGVNVQGTIIYAAKCRSAECLKLLIKAGADVNNEDGSIALCNAALSGSIESLNLLLQAGTECPLGTRVCFVPCNRRSSLC